MLQGIENTGLAIPALTAITAQIWLIARSDQRKLVKNNFPIFIFFTGVLGISLIEFFTYSSLISPSVLSMKLFYVFCSIALAGLLSLAMKHSGIKKLNNIYSKYINVILCVSFSSLMIFSSTMVQGIESIGYSVTRIPGDLYFITQFYALFLIVTIIFCLIKGAKSPENNFDKKRSKVLLFSTTPFLIIFMLLLFIMAVGIKVNASLIVPLATTYMLLVLINTERKENLFALLLKIPYTSENKSFKKITSNIEYFLSETDLGNTASLKSLTNTIEQQIVSIAVQMSNGSQIKAASLLKVSASSICRKKG